MTEAEWEQCADPAQMLEFVRPTVSERGLRLYACACCRAVWQVLSISTKSAVDVLERYVDGLAGYTEFRVQVYSQATQSSGNAETEVLLGLAAYQGGIWGRSHLEAVQGLVAACASWGLSVPSSGRSKLQAALLRDVVRWPGRSSVIAPTCLGRGGSVTARLAAGIYHSRDFDGLPVLGDALEEAGCTDGAILSHLRSPGPHVRGCWALDLVLGKE